MSDLVKNLKNVRRVISNGWCKGTSARSAKGQPVDVRSPHAKRFDIMGAIDITCFDDFDFIAVTNQLANLVEGADVPLSISEFNDATKTKRADVLDLIDRAITLAS